MKYSIRVVASLAIGASAVLLAMLAVPAVVGLAALLVGTPVPSDAWIAGITLFCMLAVAWKIEGPLGRWRRQDNSSRGKRASTQ